MRCSSWSLASLQTLPLLRIQWPRRTSKRFAHGTSLLHTALHRRSHYTRALSLCWSAAAGVFKNGQKQIFSDLYVQYNSSLGVFNQQHNSLATSKLGWIYDSNEFSRWRLCLCVCVCAKIIHYFVVQHDNNAQNKRERTKQTRDAHIVFRPQSPVVIYIYKYIYIYIFIYLAVYEQNKLFPATAENIIIIITIFSILFF